VSSGARFLDLERIERYVGGNLIWYRSVGSTNDVARQAGRDGDADGTLVLAEEQTAGRGRRRRVWHSPAGRGLYASLLVRSGRWMEQPALAQLGAGLAVAETVAELSTAEVELLWPNDCYAAGAKLAGVLVEAEATGSEIDFLVCGMGINVNQSREDLPEDLRSHATSIARLAGADIDRTEVLLRLVRRLAALRSMADAEGPMAIVRRWSAMSPSSRGAEVQVDTIEGILSGRTVGLTAQGALRVRADGSNEIREITVGELVRVRRKR
jgi:BirA family biotin operon repressor/biotin-[acetyl-CoA-carboxylase] ligase